ncbi:MAG TPA: exonuclease domain-containing protein [Burkholderiales bacterium]|nr:exonuclease domain-containing protein [Burkholderiales bacterium]
MLDQPLAFLDLETTGINAVHDRITEVGLIEIGPGDRITEWSTLVNPGVRIPPTIQNITGITDDMVALAPAFSEIARPLLARLDGKLLVAHNARFDYGFLRNEFRRAGHRYASRVLCTVKLSRKLYPHEARHNLDALMARHDVACEARHRALGDARAIWLLLQRWRRELGPERLAAVVADLVKTPAVPAGLPEGALDDIPEAPGVYLFHGENGVVLYVGKSINLRSRVMAHFSGDHRDYRDMKISQQVRRVNWIETPGELGALIEEARLIKQLAPVYNRRLRRIAELCAWHWQAEVPASPPRLVTARELDETGLGDLYGLFRSRAAALETLREVAAAHHLCPIVLGLEKGAGPCFAHQLKRCRGACVGKETRLAHGLRLGAALAQLRMRPWPFKGRIGVRERRAGALIVLDRWCYLGTVSSEGELAELAQQRPRPGFDLDTYKILTRFFASSRRDYQVVELAA